MMMVTRLKKLPVGLTSAFNRTISTSSINMVRKMVIEEKENETIVKGVPIQSDRTDFLVKPPETRGHACALCRLNLKSLKYTDIMILGQFLDSTGKLMSKKDSQLCHSQYKLVQHLVFQAQICRLLPRPPDFPQRNGGWDHLNSYFMYPYKKRDNPFAQMVQEKHWE